MLLAVRGRIPELVPYCYGSYAQPSTLFYGADTALSQEDTQQGDQQHSAIVAAITVVSTNTGLFERCHIGWLIGRSGG